MVTSSRPARRQLRSGESGSRSTKLRATSAATKQCEPNIRPYLPDLSEANNGASSRIYLVIYRPGRPAHLGSVHPRRGVSEQLMAQDEVVLNGSVEADETYVGGKRRGAPAGRAPAGRSHRGGRSRD